MSDTQFADLKFKRIKILHDGRMDVTNAANYLGMSRWHLYNHMATDNAPTCHEIFNKKFFYKADLDSWAANNTRVVSTGELKSTYLDK